MQCTKFLALILILGTLVFSQRTEHLQKTRGIDPGPEPERVDAEGWIWLFDGTLESLKKYWFKSPSAHGGGSIWWVDEDPETVDRGKLAKGTKVLWSTQQPVGTGGVMMTNRRYKDLEVMVGFKPTWNNDGGIFFRSTISGQAWQVMLDYKNANTLGGVYGEKITDVFRVDRMYTLRSETAINKVRVPWSEDWSEVWDPNGYNEIFARILGEPPTIHAWLNKPKFVVSDLKLPQKAPQLGDDGHLGIQVHNGSVAWSNSPNRYTYIKVRELNPDGTLKYPPKPTSGMKPHSDKSVTGAGLKWNIKGGNVLEIMGSLSGRYTLNLKDLKGRSVIQKSGDGGHVQFEVPGIRSGIYILEINAGGNFTTSKIISM